MDWNPTAGGLSRKSVLKPFKRNFPDVQSNGEKLANAYASLSPDQKKAFKDVVL